MKRCKARGLLPVVCDFTFLCYLYFWGDVLEEVDLAQQYLQTKGVTLDKVVTKLEALKIVLHEKRDQLVGHAIERALEKSKEYEIPVERRIRRKKTMPGEQAQDKGLQEENKRAVLKCVDRFHSELEKRSKAIKDITAILKPFKQRVCSRRVLKIYKRRFKN